MAVKQQYAFGNTVFAIVSPKPLLETRQLASFLVPSELPADYTFLLHAMEDAPPITRDMGTFRISRKENDVRVYAEDLDRLRQMAVSVFLGKVGAYELLIEKGAFVLHASYVWRDGRALLFSAPSGTGKSTQAHFWQAERGAEIINEDRVVIFPRNGTYYATGCWAMGGARVTKNVEAPIEALVLLSQGESNTVIPSQSMMTLKRLVEQCSYDSSDMAQRTKILEILCDVISTVRTLSYACVNQPTSVYELEKYL